MHFAAEWAEQPCYCAYVYNQSKSQYSAHFEASKWFTDYSQELNNPQVAMLRRLNNNLLGNCHPPAF